MAKRRVTGAMRMPHFGLMDESRMSEEEAALQRARLHIRAGRRRLRQDKLAAGVTTLYDALSFAMRWYVRTRTDELEIRKGDDLYEPEDLFRILVRSQVLDRSFDFKAFDTLLEQALEGDLPRVDKQSLMSDLEAVMTRLEITPFDEGALPPEDPSTY